MDEIVTVSIITVTQLSRYKCLKLLNEHLEGQTAVKNIIEWVIVEGSKTFSDASENQKHIEILKQYSDLNIVYIPFVENSKLGSLRNRSNDVARGDFIVCADDDDYYYPDRVEHAVTELIKSDKLIAGCTNCHVYDYLLNHQYNAGDFGQGWSSNGCLAYKKEYLLNHRYDDNKNLAEEEDFLDKMVSPIIQLNPDKVCILSSHGFNTYIKRYMLVNASNGIHPLIKRTNVTLPDNYLSRYKKIFTNPKKCDYDIVYACGQYGIEWNPNDESLGGSEQAVVNLSREWATQGYKVAVYGLVPELKFHGVDFIPSNQFPYDQLFNTLIVWREGGLFSYMQFKIKAKCILFDMHDSIIISQNKHIHKIHLDKFSKFMFKSEYHKKRYEESLQIELNERAVIIPNGVRIEDFKDSSNILRSQRNLNRFCYASCYTRGLIPLLMYTWPIIYKNNQLSEFHIYYGMEHIQDENTKTVLKQLLSQEGVMDHGRRDISFIKHEKYKSMFQLYVNNSELEIDCISVKESLVTGCIPLISNFGVFAERDGIHFEMNNFEKEDYEHLAHEIINLDNEQIIKKRDELFDSKTITRWKDVANTWKEYF